MRVIVNTDSLINFWNERVYSPEDEDRFVGEDWDVARLEASERGIKTITKNSKLLNMIGGSYSANLPTPLEQINFKIMSIGKQISFCYDISFSTQKFISGSSSKWREYLAEKDHLFWDVGPNLSGYILDKLGNIYADISVPDDDKRARSISFGMCGSKIRKCSEFRDLSLDVAKLGTLAKHLIDFSVDKYNTELNKKQELPCADLILGIQNIKDID